MSFLGFIIWASMIFVGVNLMYAAMYYLERRDRD